VSLMQRLAPRVRSRADSGPPRRSSPCKALLPRPSHLTTRQHRVLEVTNCVTKTTHELQPAPTLHWSLAGGDGEGETRRMHAAASVREAHVKDAGACAVLCWRQTHVCCVRALVRACGAPVRVCGARGCATGTAPPGPAADRLTRVAAWRRAVSGPRADHVPGRVHHCHDAA